MPSLYLGEIFAFGAVLCWAGSTQIFEAAGKQMGSIPVSFFRLLISFVLFSLLLLINNGEIIPVGFSTYAWKWLLLSGVVGLSFGDIFRFKSYVSIGPRLTMVIMSLSAPTTALIGWLILDETYRPIQWLGMFVTVCGVCWVLIKQGTKSGEFSKNSQELWVRTVSTRQLAIAMVAMVGQSVGYVMSKMGMKDGAGYLDPFASTQIRVIGGIIGFIVLFFVMGSWPRVIQSTRKTSALGLAVIGSFLGVFLGVSLSMKALHYTSTGIATTILSLVPIVLIPFAILIQKEYVSIHGILGALTAVFGVVLLIG